MMQNRITGKKISFRPMVEAQLSAHERARLYERQQKAEAARAARGHLVQAAGMDAPGFDRMARWVVATCRSGSEQVIGEELGENHIQSWCPMEKFRTRPRRGLKPVDIFRPFFRGYLFIRVVPTEEAFVGVLSASRLKGIMGRDGRPFLMPPKVMDALMLGVKKGECVQPDEFKIPVSVGDHVTIARGPFADFQAVVRKVVSDRWRAEVEINLFGSMRPVELDIDSLAA
ncbi:transcription termination/antitermination protein NusG [Neorhizobium sp. JUb45]|uniref:transcription termination/antitermination protein NusG n=1 Tax=Neorhizobium sp. JUb45 TaxID=2485113 RepID=UPI0010F05EBF|nr:transcription termination/antitermination protein NusG [Neorhizobium sp. JUb45]TCR01079.1 transcriptional antiterminator NusG [Neorhizobium sp. JUb45]